MIEVTDLEYIPEVPQNTLTIVFLLGIIPGTLLLANKSGSLQWLTNKYNEIDEKKVLLSTLLFFLLPFTSVYFYNLDIKVNSTLALMLTPILTGSGIVIGNTIINNNKYKKDINNYKKLLSVVLSNHSVKLKLILDVTIETLNYLEKYHDEDLTKDLSDETLLDLNFLLSGISVNLENIENLKNYINYQTVLLDQKLLPVEELKVLDDYIIEFEVLMNMYIKHETQLMEAISLMKNNETRRYIYSFFSSVHHQIELILEMLEDCRRELKLNH